MSSHNWSFDPSHLCRLLCRSATAYDIFQFSEGLPPEGTILVAILFHSIYWEDFIYVDPNSMHFQFSFKSKLFMH